MITCAKCYGVINNREGFIALSCGHVLCRFAFLLNDRKCQSGAASCGRCHKPTKVYDLEKDRVWGVWLVVCHNV